MIEKEVENQRIGIDTIETIELKQLSIKFDEKVVFKTYPLQWKRKYLFDRRR